MYEIIYEVEVEAFGDFTYEERFLEVETREEVEAKIRQLVESGVNPDYISVFHKTFVTGLGSLVTVGFSSDGHLQIEWDDDQIIDQMNQRIIAGVKYLLNGGMIKIGDDMCFLSEDYQVCVHIGDDYGVTITDYPVHVLFKHLSQLPHSEYMRLVGSNAVNKTSRSR